MTVKRILTINFGGIGDQVLFFPVFETLRKNFGNPLVTLVTEPRSKAVKELTELVDEVFICDLKGKNGLFELVKFLLKARRDKYDIVISSGSSKFIPIILFLTGIKERIGYDSGILSRLLLTGALRLNKNQYAANMYHDLVSDSKEDKIPSVSSSRQSPPNREVKTILIHPGVSKLSIKKGIIKSWPAENWLKLTKQLLLSGEYRVILTGGPDDEEVLTLFKERFPENVVETGSIREFANLVSNADILVCVDSAPMHIGVGLRKRVIALFGPTDEKKLLPGNELFTPVKLDSVKCRPCLWDKRQTSCETKDCLDINPGYMLEIIRGGGVTGSLDSLNA